MFGANWTMLSALISHIKKIAMPINTGENNWSFENHPVVSAACCVFT